MESTLCIDSTLKEDDFDALNDETFGAAEAWSENEDAIVAELEATVKKHRETQHSSGQANGRESYDAFNDETFGEPEVWNENGSLPTSMKAPSEPSRHMDDIINNSLMQLGLDDDAGRPTAPRNTVAPEVRQEIPLAPVMTAEQLEQLMMKQMANQAPRAKTVDELEREMRAKLQSPRSPRNPPFEERPRRPQSIRSMRPEAQMSFMGMPVPGMPRAPCILLPPPRIPMEMQMRMSQPGMSMRLPPRMHPMAAQQMQNGMIPFFGPGVRFNRTPSFMHAPPHPMDDRRGGWSPRFDNRPNRSRDRDIETFGLSAVNDHRNERMQHEDRMYHEERMYHGERAYNEPAADPYAGLMTQKEKEFIIRVQLLSLNMQSPHEDDYYYLEYMRRKSQGKAVCRNKLLIQRFGDVGESRHEVQQFENSLGKLHSYTVNAPKKILDMSGSRKLDDGDGRTVPANTDLLLFRKLLMDTERAFTLVLKLEQGAQDSKAALATEFIETVVALHERFVTVRKGRLVLMRGLLALWKMGDYRRKCVDTICALFGSLEPLMQKQKNLCDSVFVERFDLFEEIFKDCTLDEIFEIKQAVMRNASSGMNVLSEDFAQLVMEKLQEIESAA